MWNTEIFLIFTWTPVRPDFLAPPGNLCVTWIYPSLSGLLLSKLGAYRFSENAIQLENSCLVARRQQFKENGYRDLSDLACVLITIVSY